MNTEYLYPPTPLVFFAASKKHYISLLFFLSISTTPKNTVASEDQEVSGRGPKEGETCERCLSGAPGRSTCPSYLMKRPLPMNLVNGSRLAQWQRNASLPFLSCRLPSLNSFLFIGQPQFSGREKDRHKRQGIK